MSRTWGSWFTGRNGGSPMTEEKDSQQTPKRILIVEDQATLAFFLAQSLMSEAEDYEVLTATDAETAIVKMEEKPFDVIISDIVLPQMDGVALLVQTRKQWPGARVILMTAYGSGEMKKRARRMGAFAYIEKPFIYAKMRDLVFRALE